jgi:hypothetical protein
VVLRQGLGAGAIGDLDQPNDQLINIRCTSTALHKFVVYKICFLCYNILIFLFLLEIASASSFSFVICNHRMKNLIISQLIKPFRVL